MNKDEWLEMVTEPLDQNFPKGECKERGNALVLIAEITHLMTEKGLIEE